MPNKSVAHGNTATQACVVCRVCGETKRRDDFYSGQVRKDGGVGECKECTKMRVRRRARTDPKVQEYDRSRARRPMVKSRIERCVAEWKSKNPLAYKAHYSVSNAVRDGRLTKEPCLFCGSEKVHGHHRDYSKPLDVIWLCPKCHHRLHGAFPETAAHERHEDAQE